MACACSAYQRSTQRVQNTGPGASSSYPGWRAVAHGFLQLGNSLLIFFAFLIDVRAQLLELIFVELTAAVLVKFTHQRIHGLDSQHRQSLRVLLAKRYNFLLRDEMVT